MTTLAFTGWRSRAARAVEAPAPVDAPPAAEARMPTIAEAYRDLRRYPPDVHFHAGLACPICLGNLGRGDAGWMCGPCGAGWDWRGLRGRWLPLSGPSR